MATAPTPTPIKFNHDASAYGLSAEFLWPKREVISPRPSCDLLPAGGYKRIQENDFSFDGFVRFKTAYTEVSGSPNVEPHPETGELTRAANNLSLSVIEGFNLLDLVSVDRIVSRITTRFFEGSDKIEIVLIGTRFEGFRIAGKDVEIELATDIFLDHSTHKHLAYLSEGSIRRRLGTMIGRNQFVVPENKPFEATIVENIQLKGRHPGVTVDRNVIDIAHFGKLTLGELTVTPNRKSLNMLRWNLGCPNGGTGTSGGGRAGGVNPTP